jgi:hypothetical protein
MHPQNNLDLSTISGILAAFPLATYPEVDAEKALADTRAERYRTLAWIEWLLEDGQRGMFATGREAFLFLQQKIEDGERV